MDANRRRLIWFEITKRRNLRREQEIIKKDKEEHPTSQTPPYKWDDEDDPNIYISQR